MNEFIVVKRLCADIKVSSTDKDIDKVRNIYCSVLQNILELGRKDYAEHVPQYGLTLYSATFLKRKINETNEKLTKQKKDKHTYFGTLLALYHMRACILFQEADKTGGLRGLLGMGSFNREKIALASGINAQISILLGFEEANDWLEEEVTSSDTENEFRDRAICVNCGGYKQSAFEPCTKCKWGPETVEQAAISALVTRKNFSKERLEEIGRMVKLGGCDLASETLRAEGIKIEEMTRMISMTPPILQFLEINKANNPTNDWVDNIKKN
jgi:hypothetical protein